MGGPRGASAGRPIYLYTDNLTHIHPEFHYRVAVCHDWPTRRTRSRLVRRHLFGVRWPVSLGRHPTPPTSSLHSTGTTRFPIRDLHPQPVRSPRNLPLCSPVKSQIYTYDHLDLPTLQQIHDLCGKNVHFLVPLGNETWFEETGVPTSQVTELDW